jgi:VRR-NUC domain
MTDVRQLHLFRSRRQRGMAPPPPLEFEVHCALADTLRRWAMPNWLWTHLPFGERREAITGARLKRMGTQAGWPDLILIPPRGHSIQRPHFLELKRRGGSLSEQQVAFALWCKLNDCPHAVANSYEAAVAMLQQWGALRTGVKVQ